MITALGPFLFCRLPRLVQDVGMDRKLAYVVQQGGPTKPVAVGCGQVQPIRDQVGQGADTFGMAACPSVVTADRSGQRQDPLGYCRGHGTVGDGLAM
jgi:hypothetical protein